ncbi:MAG: hypothetical protein ACOC35_05685 [Promethearchaeia archaeon]
MRKKNKKYRFSKKEKQFIQDMKQNLEMMGIPRDQWARLIQQELQNKRKSEKGTGPLNEKSKIGKFFSKIRHKIEKFFFNLFKKRMMPEELLEAEEAFEEMFGENPFDTMSGGQNPFEALSGDQQFGSMSKQERELMDLMNPMGRMQQVDKLGNQGTFVADRKDKKKKIVDLDFGDLEDKEEE